MIYPRVKQHVEFDELVALGNAGLAEAAQRFDPTRGASFKTFAWYRVQGSIIDGLRKATNLPRRAWAKLVALRAASEYLEHRAERDVGAAQHGVKPAEGADALAAIKQRDVGDPDDVRHVARGACASRASIRRRRARAPTRASTRAGSPHACRRRCGR